MARFFIDHYNAKFKRRIDGISPEAESLMLAHDWPGNVRELRNAIERSMILEDTAYIRPSSLPIAVRGPDSTFPEPEMVGDVMSLVEQERRLLIQALEKTSGNQTQAARLLHITRDTLRYKMKKFNLR
jgi:transcriptional regulator with PAS, ATPase and Fis domain